MKTLEDLIKDQIDNIDLDIMVQKSITTLISDAVKRKIASFTDERVKEIINTEIDITLKKGIQTDDGWGKRVSYQSFEELFKKTFAEKMANSYEVKRDIERIIKERTDALYKEQVKAVTEKLKSELLK